MDYFLISLKPLLFTGSSPRRNNATSGLWLRTMVAQKLSLNTSFPESGRAGVFSGKGYLSPENFLDLCLEKAELCQYLLGKPQRSVYGDPWDSEETPNGPDPLRVPGPKRCEGQTQEAGLQVLTLCSSRSPSALNYFTIEMLLLSSFGKRILFLNILMITLIDYLKFETFLNQGPWILFRDLRIWVGKIIP